MHGAAFRPSASFDSQCSTKRETSPGRTRPTGFPASRNISWRSPVRVTRSRDSFLDPPATPARRIGHESGPHEVSAIPLAAAISFCVMGPCWRRTSMMCRWQGSGGSAGSWAVGPRLGIRKAPSEYSSPMLVFQKIQSIDRIFQDVYRERKVETQGLAPNNVNGLALRARFCKTLSHGGSLPGLFQPEVGDILRVGFGQPAVPGIPCQPPPADGPVRQGLTFPPEVPHLPDVP